MDAIRLYLDTRHIQPEQPLFAAHSARNEGTRLNTRTVRGRVVYWLEKAGIQRRGVTPHSLTHTAALLWLNAGLSVDEVRRRMRHGTLDTTMIYFKQQGLLNKNPEELKQIER